MPTAYKEGELEPTAEDTTSPSASTEEGSPGEGRREHEDELVEWVQGLKEEAEKRKREDSNQDKWDEWANGFWGEQWPSTIPSFKAPVVANELQSLMLQEVSDLTDGRIRIFVQKDPAKAGRDEDVEKAIQAYWTNEHIDYQIMLAALDALVYPCGFLSCTWDPSKKNGFGEIQVQARNPASVLPDPDADDDTNWRYVMFVDDMDLVEIRRLWPDNGWRVEPEGSQSKTYVESRPKQRSGRYKGPLYTPGLAMGSESYMKARATVVSLFIYDDATEEQAEEIVDPKTGEKKLKSKLRLSYPNGRLIQVANNVVLFDGKNPYTGPFPCIRVCLLPSPHQFWPPHSLVGGVVELQMASNKLESAVVENAIRLNNGIIIADSTSGIDPDNFYGIPGQVLLKNPQSAVTITYPPSMPADMVNSGSRLRQVMREVLGYTPARTGTGTRGNVAAELSETEISQAMGVTRLRARLLYQAVQKLTEQIFYRMAQFYSYPRYIPYLTADQWESVPWKPLKSDQYKSYAVHVDPASFQVRSKTMMQRLSLALAKMNKLPVRELLKVLEFPDADRIADEHRKEMILAALAKQRQRGGGGRS